MDEEVQTRPIPRVVSLAETPVIPAEDWPENVAVANMITRENSGSNLLLGACWVDPHQTVNPWSFEDEDPGIPGVTHWGPVHETYFVLAGRLVLSWDHGELEIGPNDAVYIPPGWRYGLRSVSDEKAFLIWSMTPAPV